MYSVLSRFISTSFILNILAHTLLTASSLDFEQSYQELLEINFGLQSANAIVWAKGGEVQQAGARPNPILAVNLNSLGQSSCNDQNQAFVGITQLVELGGKRAARIRVADAEQTVSMWELEIQKNDLYANLMKAFINVAAAQEKAQLAAGQQKVAEQILSAIMQKTSSGKTTGLEQKKAEIAVRTARLTAARQQSNLQKAKRELAAFWGTSPPSFDTVNFPLYELNPPPPLESLYDALGSNPEIGRVEAESTRACEMVSLEQARAVPDISFVVGVTTEKFVKDPGFSVGFAIPLPLCDKNRGNINRASYGQIQAIYDQMDAYAQMKSSLTVVYGEWMAAFEQAIILKDEVLPSAEESFLLAQESYKEGKHDYLYLLDAQSTLIDIKEQSINAIEEYQLKRAEALRLTAPCNL